jgi:formamidopyrimidine-DNA glycosylase
MPELPEVETTKRGILPHLTGKTLTAVFVKQPKLRYPVPITELDALINSPLIAINRRAKYLLLHFEDNALIIHLGMAGSLRITTPDSEWRKHDHWQLTFGETALRYHDMRRFGFLIADNKPESHPLLTKLGIEPLADAFTVERFAAALKKRRSPIKTCIMNNAIVVGIGNIYACESLFLAGVHPARIATSLTIDEITRLHQHIVAILNRAIAQGGSTLKDFVNPDGNPGYFAQTLAVYGRENKPCPVCKTPIENIKLAGRSSCYCPKCQPLTPSQTTRRTRQKRRNEITSSSK